MFSVAQPFVTLYQRFAHGMSVKPEDCNDQAHFDALVASGHITRDPPIEGPAMTGPERVAQPLVEAHKAPETN
jgi:hypothetical protein